MDGNDADGHSGLLGGGARRSARANKSTRRRRGGYRLLLVHRSDFDKVPGVLATTSGYIGGRTANPTYEQVSAGNSGHIEALRVVYDPSRVTYAALVRHALRTSDPTDGGGQFCDRGDQYRPAIFVAGPAERKAAESAKAEAAKVLGKPIATDILPRGRFYSAEGYHQDYYKKNPIKYRFYRLSCGRDARVKEVWGDAAR